MVLLDCNGASSGVIILASIRCALALGANKGAVQQALHGEHDRGRTAQHGEEGGACAARSNSNVPIDSFSSGVPCSACTVKRSGGGVFGGGA